MNIILDLIKYLFEKFNQKKIYIIIDQYKEKIDPKNNIIQEIKNMILSSDFLNVIVCNSLNEKDFRKSLKLYLKNPQKFFLNYLFVRQLIIVPSDDINKLNNEEKKLLSECGNLYEYFYKIKRNKYKMNMKDLKEMIIKEIAEKFKKYYEKNENNKIINKIKKLNLSINTKVPFNKLSEISDLFPLKYFNISIDSKSSFKITDIKEDSSIVFNFSYSIVIDPLIRIYYSYKNLEKNIISNVDIQKSYLEFVENFNEYLWITRFKNFYKGCQIQAMIQISSIIKLEGEDIKIYNDGLAYLTKKEDSILITKKEPNTQYFDTGILKCLNNNESSYELYLFKETIRKASDERLNEILLKSLKYYLRLLFKTKLNINIENVYFSYVFKGEDLDTTTINYCIINQINYLLFYENEIKIDDSNIDNKVSSFFHYLQNPNKNIMDKIELTPFDIDFKKESKNIINDEFNKLDSYLKKKRNKKKESLELIKNKLENATKFDKIQFRKNNYEELLLDEELIENQPIIGISYKIDTITNNLLKKINLDKSEEDNFLEIVKHFGNNLKILSVTKINDLGFNWVPSFRCAVLSIDNKNNKFYYDIANKKLYNLRT